MKLVFIYGTRLSSKLTKFWTGSTCYHVGFTDGIRFWDMNLIRRRRLWPGLYPSDQCIVVGCPVPVTSDYLDYKLDTDTSRYGVGDYLMFGFRWLYHLFGQSTRNVGGVICSEMVATDMVNHGWNFPLHEVPSPADLELAVLGRINALLTDA